MKRALRIDKGSLPHRPDRSLVAVATRRTAAAPIVIACVLAVALGSFAAAQPTATPAPTVGLEAPEAGASLDSEPRAAPTAEVSPLGAAAAETGRALRDGAEPLRTALTDALPAALRDLRFLDVLLWQWAALGLLLVCAVALSWVAVQLLQRAARPLVSRTLNQIDDALIAALLPPLRLLVTVLLLAAGFLVLALEGSVENFLQGVLTGLGVAAVAWAGLRVIDVFAEVTRRRLEQDDSRAVASIVPLGRRAAKAFLLIVAVVVLLQNVGVNVTGLIAGLGVGGIAVALAAQKTIENVFGGVSVISDQPVRVGDFCRFGDGRLGTVEEIGLRSTRIRTLDRTLVTIPNADFAQRELENFALRDRMRLHTVLGVRYETTPGQLRHLLEALRGVLRGHPLVSPDPARVRFVSFGASALEIEVFAYVTTPDYNEFLRVREEIYLQIMDAVESAGTSFAFPSQTLYLGRDQGLDPERVRAAEEAGNAGRGDERAGRAST